MLVVDLSLARLPGKFFWNRARRKREWMTTIPIILRDLAPTSGFDPQRVWEESKRDDEEVEETKASEESKDSGQKKQKKAAKSVSKKDTIIANQQKIRDVVWIC
jgi:hypothetical protein